MRFIVQVICLMVCLTTSVHASLRFLSISDVHYGSKNTSGDGKDTGTEALNHAMEQFSALSKEVDFILTLGDLPTHLHGYSPEKEEYEKTVFHAFYEANVNLKPMFYISGNNDPLSGNYQPFEVNGKSPLSAALDWSGACMHCDGLILDATHMAGGGYYSTYVVPDNKDIILIALNTTQWTRSSIFLPHYPHQELDALVQLYWFKEQLKKHHAKQLLIAMHIPPGKNYVGANNWEAQYLEKFLSILEEHQHAYEQISLLTSHSHMDEFRKIQLSSGRAIYAYSTPGLSRLHHNNSAMKVFSLNPDSKLHDFVTYYTTDDKEWGQNYYHASNSDEAIFPYCADKTLAECLDGMSDKHVCDYVARGLFYGVKSDRVNNKECNTIYRVNNHAST